MTYYARLYRGPGPLTLIAEYRVPRPFPAIEELTLPAGQPERRYRLTGRWLPVPRVPSLVYLRYDEEGWA